MFLSIPVAYSQCLGFPCQSFSIFFPTHSAKLSQYFIRRVALENGLALLEPKFAELSFPRAAKQLRIYSRRDVADAEAVILRFFESL